MKLKYELKQWEIEESLLCLDWQREGKAKLGNLGVMGTIAVGCMIGYLREPARFFLLVFAGVTVGMMFLLLYVPELRRRRRAKAMVRQKGIYQIMVPAEGIKRGFESEHVFTIQGEKENYCIPKRILNQKEKQELRNILNSGTKEMLRVKTGREQGE